MESLENRMKIRKLLIFPEIQEICFNDATLSECRDYVKEVRIDHRLKNSAIYDGRDHIINFNMYSFT